MIRRELPPTNFSEAMDQARQGSESAFEYLVDKYGGHVKRYLKRQISQKLRTKVDESDLAQMVWASFFDNRSQVLEFDNSQDMIAYLVGMAGNKAKVEANRFGTEKRALDREYQLDSERDELNARRATDTPSQIAIRQEQLAKILEGLSDRDRSIINMRIEGLKRVDIARRLGVSESLVRKVLAKAKAKGLGDQDFSGDHHA